MSVSLWRVLGWGVSDRAPVLIMCRRRELCGLASYIVPRGSATSRIKSVLQTVYVGDFMAMVLWRELRRLTSYVIPSGSAAGRVKGILQAVYVSNLMAVGLGWEL